MKILHIVPSYLPAYGYGGPILSVHSLNKWLVRKRADVTVYTTNIDGRKRLDVPLNQEVNMDGVKVFYFPITLAPWQYSSAMREALKRNAGDFDLIHITSVFLAASTLGACYAKKFRKPYIISPRGSLMREPLEKKSAFKKSLYLALFERSNLSGATAIHFTAEEEKKEYIGAGLPLNNSFIVPNGLDAETLDKQVPPGVFRGKFKIGADKKIFLSLGRLSWKKGFDTLIPAFRKVVREIPEAVLVIAGGDEEGYKKTIERFVSENDLETGKNVLFTGELLDDMKLAAFKESDVFVLPSYSENFGMAVIEAMKLGLPVVISAGTAIASFVAKNNAGVVVNKEEDVLADKMIWMIKNPEAAREMSIRAKKLVEEEFSMDKVADMMLAEYNKILKK